MNSEGLARYSMAMDRRLRCPPDSFSTKCPCIGSKPKIFMTSSTRALRSAAEKSRGRRSLAASISVRTTLSELRIRSIWGTKPTSYCISL